MALYRAPLVYFPQVDLPVRVLHESKAPLLTGTTSLHANQVPFMGKLVADVLIISAFYKLAGKFPISIRRKCLFFGTHGAKP